MTKKYDLAVVGSGVLGTFHAYHAALLGLRVIVLEKDLFPMEASVRNFGQVVPSGFPVGRWHHYGRYSTQLYKSFQEKFNIGIRNNGSTYIASSADELELLEELQSNFAAADYHSVLLSKEEVLEKYPDIHANYAVGALSFPQEVSAESRTMIHHLHTYLKETTTIEFSYASPVIGVEDKETEVELQTSNLGKIKASKVVICNGRDFRLLFPEIFSKSEIEVVKINMMVTKPMPEVKLAGNILTGLTIRRYESFKALNGYKNLNWENVNQEAINYGIHILFKQRVDGSIVIGDSHEYADASKNEELGFDVNMSINNIILFEAKKILNLRNWDIQHFWNGFYSQMKGNKEIFDSNISTNIKVVTAIGGKGMTASAGYSKESIDNFFN
jgi:FAD dependent oxidoreductase TIGR03364